MRKSLPHLLTLLITAIFTVSCQAGEPAPNLVANGDFTIAADGGAPGSWKIADKQDVVTIEAKDNEDGKKALVVEIKKGGKGLGQIYQTIAVKPNTYYVLKGEIKGADKDMALIQIKRYKDGKEVQRMDTGKNKTADWQKVNKLFNSGDADHVYILCRYVQKDETVGKKVCFANINLKEMGELLYEGEEVAPRAVATFNSIGLYWKPTDGGPSRPCTARYRKAGTQEWREALNLWCDPNDHS
ncbi:MAG: hypothetical protein JXR97_01215, partial [Planctomycetes bacterium]|nr:hypothetical protein [Planctomycetota bacterium]